MEPSALLLPGLVGALVAGALAFGLGRTRLGAVAVAASALAGGILAARLYVAVPDGFPPVYAEHWLTFTVPVAAAVAIAEGRGWLRGAAAWATRVVLCCGLVYAILGAIPALREHPLVLGGNALALVALWFALDRFSRRGPSILLIGGYGVACGAAAIAIGVHYMLSAGQVATAIALASATALLVLRKQPLEQVGPATVPVFIVAYGSVLLLGGHHTDEFPLGALVLLALCPLGAWVLTPGPRAGAPVRRRVMAGALACLAIGAVAVWRAWPAARADDPYALYR